MGAASAAPFAINRAVKMGSSSQTFLWGSRVGEAKTLTCELCRQFYHLGGVSGCITIKVQDNSVPKPQRLNATYPSGVQKERMKKDDKPLAKFSDCGPLFLKAECHHYLFDAAIKLHQFGLEWPTPSVHSPQRVVGRQRNSQVKAKAGNNIEPSRHCIILDIEGTTTPISFVTDVLFPYARDSVGKHLELTYDTAETQDDINLLRAQVEEDLENNVVGAVPIPSDGDKEDIIAALVANVEAMIKADRKITSLKQLQGHIWRTGFQNKELEAVVYDDVPEALQEWHALGIKVYIYSSGSRLAQRLLFGNTNYGDLRKYLCGFFDTTVGNKKETKSYIEITESVGVDYPSQVLFVTDAYQEATAAKAAGLEVIISIRPGNAPLPDNHCFETIKSFSEI